MAKADSVHSTPPTNTSAIDRPMFPPRDPTRRRFLAVAAVASAVSAGSLAAATQAANVPQAVTVPQGADPIFAVIKRHRAASIVWDAAVDVRSDFPEGPEPMTDEQWEQWNTLDDAVDDARDALNQTGVDFISTTPTTVSGIVSAIAYIQRQMRDDGTFMPFDIEFHFDVGYEGGDGGVVFGWIDAFLNTIAAAVSELDPAGKVVWS
jgi:hypothetical protein